MMQGLHGFERDEFFSIWTIYQYVEYVTMRDIFIG